MVFSVREIPHGGAVVDSQQTHYSFEPPAHLNQTTLRIAANQCHMTQLMAQMSQLVHFSGDLFNNLLQEATSTYQRINGLAQRIQSATQGIDNFEKMMSKKSGQSLMSNPRTEYVNLPLSESSFFTTENRPDAVKVVFSKAEQPPKLHLMDPYIEGSENGLKALDLYTSPRFFLDEWIAEQIKLRQAAKEERKKRREERKARRAAAAEGDKGSNLGPAKPKRLEKVQYDPLTGERIIVKEAPAPAATQYSAPSSTMTMAQVAEYSWSNAPPAIESYNSPQLSHSTSKSGYSAPPPPSSSFAPPPPPSAPGSYSAPSFGGPPPPPSMPGSYSAAPSFGGPPPPPSFGGSSAPSFGGPPPPPSMPGSYSAPSAGGPPPPPPPAAPNAPPPPPAPGAPPPPPASFGAQSSGMANAIAGVSLKSAPQQPVSKPVDARSDLLSAIRGGRALNKVQVQEKKEEAKEEGSSVASILARRIAIVGDSDSEDDDGDDDDWD